MFFFFFSPLKLNQFLCLNFKSKNCVYLDFFKQLGRLSVSNSSTQVMEWAVGLRESWNHSDFFKQQKNIVKREPTITGKTFIHQSDMRVAYHMGPLYPLKLQHSFSLLTKALAYGSALFFFIINYIELFIFSSCKVLGILHHVKGGAHILRDPS